MTKYHRLDELNDYIDHPLITDHAFCMAIARTGNDLFTLKNLAYETAKIHGLQPIISQDGKVITFIKPPHLEDDN